MIRYMNYLGHNEFGLNHKSWNDPVKFKDTNNINYWIEQWVLFYQNIIENYCNSKNCYFVIYEKLINKKYLTDLINKIDLNINNISSLNNFKNSNTKRSEFKINKSIFKKSMKIYDQFINQ